MARVNRPRKNKKEITKANPCAAGRPSLFTPELVNQLCELIKGGLSRGKAAQYLKITLETLSQWEKQYPEFLDSLTYAEIECEKYHIDRIKNAKTGAGEADWKASAWMLARKWPNDYSEKVKQEITGKDGVPLIDATSIAREIMKQGK